MENAEGFLFTDDYINEMFWLVTVLPSMVICYYTGLWGGIFTVGMAIIFNLLVDLLEAIPEGNMDIREMQISMIIIVLQIGIVASLGIIVERLKRKELELKQLNEKLKRLALVDELTGIHNRRGLLAFSDYALTNYSSSVYIYIDLDGFKQINDQYGHDIGDQLLQITAERLKTCIRKDDIAGRMGGDEFICILTNAGQYEAKHIVTRIIHILSKPIYVKEKQIVVTSSIGIAVSPFDGSNTKELLKSADKAMYQAKKQGKNQHYFAMENKGESHPYIG